MTPPRPCAWLPLDTLGGPRSARPVAQLVTAWRTRWIGGNGWCPGPAFVPVGNESGWEVLRRGDGVTIVSRPKAVLELSFAMLGVRPRTDLTDADAKLMRRLAGAALDDLQAAVETVSTDTAGGSSWRLPIMASGREILAIELPHDALAAIARKSFGTLARSTRLSPVGAAVAGRTVPCAAYLGRATLSIEQFGALEPGDIVLLDQAVDDTLPLAVAGRPTPFRAALNHARQHSNTGSMDA